MSSCARRPAIRSPFLSRVSVSSHRSSFVRGPGERLPEADRARVGPRSLVHLERPGAHSERPGVYSNDSGATSPIALPTSDRAGRRSPTGPLSFLGSRLLGDGSSRRPHRSGYVRPHTVRRANTARDKGSPAARRRSADHEELCQEELLDDQFQPSWSRRLTTAATTRTVHLRSSRWRLCNEPVRDVEIDPDACDLGALRAGCATAASESRYSRAHRAPGLPSWEAARAP